MFGQWLRELRRFRQLTQGELATRAGTSQNYISALERGEIATPRGTTIQRLAAVLEVEAKDLVAALMRNIPPPELPPTLADLYDSDPPAGAWAAPVPVPLRALLDPRPPTDTWTPATPDAATAMEVIDLTPTQRLVRCWVKHYGAGPEQDTIFLFVREEHRAPGSDQWRIIDDLTPLYRPADPHPARPAWTAGYTAPPLVA